MLLHGLALAAFLLALVAQQVSPLQLMSRSLSLGSHVKDAIRQSKPVKATKLLSAATFWGTMSSSGLHSSLSSTSTVSATATASQFQPDRSVAQSTTIFVGNLPFSITEEEIQGVISENMGPNLVKNVQIIRGEKTKRFMGFIFIHFFEHHVALSGVEFFDGLVYGDRTLNSNLKTQDEAYKKFAAASKKKKSAQRKYEHSIYLANLDYSLTERELVNMCDDILGPGQVDFVHIPLDKKSKSPRGYAQIQFTTKDVVDKAILEFNGLEVFDRLLRCERLKEPKDIGKKVPKEEGAGDGDDLSEFFDDNFQASE